MADWNPFTIGAATVEPGQRATVDLPVASLYTHTEMTMPVHVVHGKRPGPCLFLSAAIHGDEINGVEVIRRILRRKGLKRLRGTLIAVPVVNVYGFVNNYRYLPDRRDLNRFFPGSPAGSLTSRLADIFMEEIVSRCTHGIDFHTGSNHRINLPQIRSRVEDSEALRLARVFGAPVVVDAHVRDGSLRQAASELGIPMLLYEAGEALRFDEVAIRAGLRGTLRVMATIGMLPEQRIRPPVADPIVARSSSWARAPVSGIIRARAALGDRVEEDEALGYIADPFGAREETVLSPASGIIIGRLNLPLVHQGDAVFHVARFKDPPTAESVVEAFQQEYDPDQPTSY